MSAFDEDEEVWQETVKGVNKLNFEKRCEGKKTSKRFLKSTENAVSVPLKIYRHDLKKDTTADIDKNTMRRFKRHEFPIEGTLDLHGMTEEKAYKAVFSFVTQSYLSGKRCILIVTGKGLSHLDEDPFAFRGVLKTSVPRWLESEELSPLILSYTHPAAKYGGSGALCLLLRRRRPD